MPASNSPTTTTAATCGQAGLQQKGRCQAYNLSKLLSSPMQLHGQDHGVKTRSKGVHDVCSNNASLKIQPAGGELSVLGMLMLK